MSSILYREGKGTIEHGIVCESINCEPGEVDGLLAAGWSANPPGYVPPEPVVAEPIEDPVDPTVVGDLKSELDTQIDNLTEQNRILTELDEASKSEIQRLTSEVERLTGELAFAGESEEALKGEIVALNAKLNAEPDADIHEDGDDSNINPVRLAAKEKGIEGWDTKRIATLERMLEA